MRFSDLIKQLRFQTSAVLAVWMQELAFGVVAVQEPPQGQDSLAGRFYLYFNQTEWEMVHPNLAEALLLSGEDVSDFTEENVGILNCLGCQSIDEVRRFAIDHLRLIAPWHKEPLAVEPPNLQADLT
ncbi:MAG: hypothetical protein WC508_04195 [Patescibacteria group bacterium]